MSAEGALPKSGRTLAAELGRRLVLVASAAGIGHWTREAGQPVAHWSDALRRLHGLAPGDPVPTFGDWLRRHVHCDDRAALLDAARRWEASGSDSIELAFRLVTADGRVREVLTHSVLDPGRGAPVQFGVVIDLATSRSSERALRQAESRAALAARAVGMGTWEIDLQTGVAHWDEQMWALRGLPPRAEPPTLDERLAMVHPDDRAAVRRIGETATTQAYEFRVVWPDGQVRWLASRSTVLADDDGAPARRIGVNWDITASRAAEAELHERALALKESEARSRLLAGMSHELRTPLNAILGFAQLLQSEEDGDDAAARRRRMCVDQILHAGDHLLGLVDKVLELTRARRHAPAGDPAPAPTPAGEPAPTLPPPAAGQPRRTVLYIEDNAVNSMIVAELVARRGDLGFEAAMTGTEGLARAAELQPSLILLDMQLPDIDGPEVFRRLAADERTKHIPCVALSANALPADIDAARAAGMADYWTKPLDFRVFTKSLDKLFGPAPSRAG